MAAVRSTHPQYDQHVDRWLLVRDVVNSNVTQYIKPVDTSDKTRNDRYKDDARLTNFTARTKNGLVGAMFRKDVEIDLPDSIAYLEDDATGDKLSLTKLSQEVSGETLQAGRYGLLTDFPASEDGLTVAEVTNMNLKARIYKYKAENIRNWQCTPINGQLTVTMITLEEAVDSIGEDGFTWEQSTQYRVLRLIQGTYMQQLFDEEDNLLHEYIPRGFDGAPWDHIPFVFVGAVDNNCKVDPSPLHDLASLNIGHLRNSADYEESVHITGQPTLVISTDMSNEEFRSANPNGFQIGARRGINLGPGGSANLLQATPNQLADVAMQRKEEQAVMIGARLVVPAGSSETAEATRIKHSGENSVLSILSKNVEDAINQSLLWASRFMGEEQSPDDIIFILNDQFFDVTLDPQMVMAQLQLFNNGIIATQDIRHTLRKTGTIQADRTDDDIDEDVSNIDPIGGGGFDGDN